MVHGSFMVIRPNLPHVHSGLLTVEWLATSCLKTPSSLCYLLALPFSYAVIHSLPAPHFPLSRPFCQAKYATHDMPASLTHSALWTRLILPYISLEFTCPDNHSLLIRMAPNLQPKSYNESGIHEFVFEELISRWTK